MSPEDNAATVVEIYAAYMRGDTEAALALMSDDIVLDQWDSNSAQEAGVPWMLKRSGKDAVREFYAEAATMGVSRMSLGAPMTSRNLVAVEVTFEAGTPPLTDCECHVWTFNDEGEAIELRHFLDTAKHIHAAGRSWPANQHT